MFLFHFNVVCSDFDTSYDFYTNAVGMHSLTSSRAGTAAKDARQVAALNKGRAEENAGIRASPSPREVRAARSRTATAPTLQH